MSLPEPQASLAFTNPAGDPKVLVAYQDSCRRVYFPRPVIDASQVTGHAMLQAHAEMPTKMAKTILGFPLYRVALYRPVVETATVSAYRLNDAAADHFPCEIFLSDRQSSPELTALLNGYTAFSGSVTPFSWQYPDMTIGSTTTGNGGAKKVVVISHELKQGAMLQVIVWGLILCTMVSLILGLRMGNIQVAFQAFGAMTLVMSVPLIVILK